MACIAYSQFTWKTCDQNRVINAIGPETFNYLSPGMGYAASCVIGWLVRDTFITREEIKGLMGGLLCVDTPPTGKTLLTDWMQINADTLGRNYASELARRQDRRSPYFPIR